MQLKRLTFCSLVQDLFHTVILGNLTVRVLACLLVDKVYVCVCTVRCFLSWKHVIDFDFCVYVYHVAEGYDANYVIMRITKNCI